MLMKLKDRVAVVTGGNSGIGLVTAQKFARHGAKVAIFGRDSASLTSAADSIGTETLTVQGDVLRLKELDRLYETVSGRFGKVDVLVANAGIAKFAPVSDTSEALFEEVCGVNFKGTFFTLQRALPYLRDGASVILVGAAAASRQGHPLTSIYTATKAAVHSLALSFSAELVPRRIRVNIISPGMTDTPIISRSGGMPGATPAEIASAITSIIPLKRRGTPEEMANAMLFLASDDSRTLLRIPRSIIEILLRSPMTSKRLSTGICHHFSDSASILSKKFSRPP
jgi:NAD(P)-dependent dehydrogenase (short-subunit alcohol dehydrogenase family)